MIEWEGKSNEEKVEPMPQRFITVDRETPYMMPPSINEWLPEGHLARFVVEIVQALDLREIEGAYSGRGEKAHSPQVLLGLMFYGYATGIFSSRKLEQATYDSVAFRYVTGDTHPDHDTIATFRKRFIKELKTLFLQVLQIAQEMGCLKLGNVSLDGTKIKAKEARSGKKPGGKDPRPPEAGPKDKDQVNLTDAESRIMPCSSGGFEQGYNGQASVDVDTMLIVGGHVSQNTNDKQEVDPALEELQRLPEVLGEVKGLLADTGYFSKANVERCEEESIVPYISTHREKHNQWLKKRLGGEILEKPSEGADAVEQMKHRLQTDAGRRIYARRKSTVETTFGIIKAVMGYRQFLLRGLDCVQGEWDLVCTAYNLKRLHALRG